jgi:hypothetical protein
MNKDGKHVVIGKYTISTAYHSEVSGKNVVDILKEDGEGGGFDAEKVERAIDEFFEKEF